MESQLKNRIEITRSEWYKAGVRRYGENQTAWKFRCPSCGEVFGIEDWTKKKISGLLPLQDCPLSINDNEKIFCIWNGFGSLNLVHIKDENWFWLTTSVFDFADDPLNGGQI